MPSNLAVLFALFAPLVAAQGSTTVETLFFPEFGIKSWVGSLVASQATARTYDLSCPASVTSVACSIAPIRVTEGISRVELDWAAKTTGTQTLPSGHISCTVSSPGRLTCLETLTGTTYTSTTDNASTLHITALITAGLDKTSSPTTVPVSNNGTVQTPTSPPSQPTAPPTSPSPSPSPPSAATKLSASHLIAAGAAIGFAIVAIL